MAAEAVVPDQPGHLFDEIHFTLQIHRTGGGHLHQPPFVVGIKGEGAAQGREDLHDLGIEEIAAFLRRTVCGANIAASSQMAPVPSCTELFSPPITPARATAWSA